MGVITGPIKADKNERTRVLNNLSQIRIHDIMFMIREWERRMTEGHYFTYALNYIISSGPCVSINYEKDREGNFHIVSTRACIVPMG